MKNGKYQTKKAVPMKSMAVLLALVLLLGCAAGGTLAWLMDTTDEVKNTFTTSDVDIELKENTGSEYQMVPGHTIDKDPKVTVKADSEACYVFVKVTKSNNFDTFMTYQMADGWTLVPNQTDVYYREQTATTADVTYSVLKDDKVTVKSDVTKAMMDGLTNDTLPTLTFQAAAIQMNKSNGENGKFGVEEAYGQVQWP